MTPDNNTSCFGLIPGGLLDSLIDAETGRFDTRSLQHELANFVTSSIRPQALKLHKKFSITSSIVCTDIKHLG